MEFFKPGVYFDFMRVRKLNFAISAAAAVVAILLYFVPGPNWGVDFKGGTELELAFTGGVSSAQLRAALTELGYEGADVVGVEGRQNQFIVRVAAVSSLAPATQRAVVAAMRAGVGGVTIEGEPKFSPGGDKISIRANGEIPIEALRAALTTAGARIRDVTRFGSESDHRYEAQLVGVSDEIVSGLKAKLGDKAPDNALRVEWVGPRAGEQLRNAGIMSMLYAIVFIMLYVAFRFDMRFAPGGVIAMIHDALITFGILILLRREITLTSVAAILTIVGYSINDTVVVYDRVRENLGRMKGKPLVEIINVSVSDTLSRTILTGGTTVVSMVFFFVYGTQVIQDFALTMIIGILIGTYSSIYVAAPIMEFIDRRFFRNTRKSAPSRRIVKNTEAAA
jgi:preprotein translocase subunit SecF